MVVCLSKVLKGSLFQQHMVVVVAAAAVGIGIVIVVITSIIVIVIISSSSSTTTPSRPVYKASKPKLKYQEGSMPSLPRHACTCKPIGASITRAESQLRSYVEDRESRRKLLLAKRSLEQAETSCGACYIAIG